ncbi:hypothetical protein D3C85_748230 [compost metagenome]
MELAQTIDRLLDIAGGQARLQVQQREAQAQVRGAVGREVQSPEQGLLGVRRAPLAQPQTRLGAQ